MKKYFSVLLFVCMLVGAFNPAHAEKYPETFRDSGSPLPIPQNGDHPFPVGDHPFPFGDHPFPLIHEARVIEVVDGDTFDVISRLYGTRWRVNMIGVDAPERSYMGRSQGSFAYHATLQLHTLFSEYNRIVLAFEHDDPFAHLNADREVNAHVFYFNENEDEYVSINEMMLRDGWGVAHMVAPWLMQTKKYLKITGSAMRARRGLFALDSGVKELPFEFRYRISRAPFSFWVGHFTTKKVFSGLNFSRVPVTQRVFFESLTQAEDYGYSKQK